MTCICYGANEYEGHSVPLKILPTVIEAREWWIKQFKLHHQGRTSNGWYDLYCIAEFADTGVIHYYERQGNRLVRGHTKEWRISETKETTP